jgi:hypothetical protein
MPARPVARLPVATNPVARALDDWLLMGAVLAAALIQLVTSVPHGRADATPYTRERCAHIFPLPVKLRDPADRADMIRLRSLCEAGAVTRPLGAAGGRPVRTSP